MLSFVLNKTAIFVIILFLAQFQDITLSECFVDPHSITTFPSIKYKLYIIIILTTYFVAQEFISSSYCICNSHGDALIMPQSN